MIFWRWNFPTWKRLSSQQRTTSISYAGFNFSSIWNAASQSSLKLQHVYYTKTSHSTVTFPEQQNASSLPFLITSYRMQDSLLFENKMKKTFLRPSSKSLPLNKGHKNLQDLLSSCNTQSLSSAISPRDMTDKNKISEHMISIKKR